MRIISQDRRHSIDFAQIHLWMQYEMIYAKTDQEQIVLGNYASEERAIEVFMDIHNAYAPVGIITTNLSEAQIEPFIGSDNVSLNVIEMNEPGIGVTTYDSYVYWMPEK